MSVCVFGQEILKTCILDGRIAMRNRTGKVCGNTHKLEGCVLSQTGCQLS